MPPRRYTVFIVASGFALGSFIDHELHTPETAGDGYPVSGSNAHAITSSTALMPTARAPYRGGSIT